MGTIGLLRVSIWRASRPASAAARVGLPADGLAGARTQGIHFGAVCARSSPTGGARRHPDRRPRQAVRRRRRRTTSGCASTASRWHVDCWRIAPATRTLALAVRRASRARTTGRGHACWCRTPRRRCCCRRRTGPSLAVAAGRLRRSPFAVTASRGAGAHRAANSASRPWAHGR
ncbi:MAG: hypothetical protein MZW92_56960 [Comamonadaceae bacterium]|nr:hypothetical protein [Comamonadaceae bacterium]